MLPNSQRGFALKLQVLLSLMRRLLLDKMAMLFIKHMCHLEPLELKIYSSGNAGNLDVTVKEEDGTENFHSCVFLITCDA